jgi:hypothetical protein
MTTARLVALALCIASGRALLADLPVVPTPRPTARPTAAIPATPTPGVIPTWTPPVPTSTTVAATPTATTATPVPTATAPTFTPAASPTPTTAPTPSGPWVAMGNGWQSTRVTASGYPAGTRLRVTYTLPNGAGTVTAITPVAPSTILLTANPSGTTFLLEMLAPDGTVIATQQGGTIP